LAENILITPNIMHSVNVAEAIISFSLPSSFIFFVGGIADGVIIAHFWSYYGKILMPSPLFGILNFTPLAYNNILVCN